MAYIHVVCQITHISSIHTYIIHSCLSYDKLHIYPIFLYITNYTCITHSCCYITNYTCITLLHVLMRKTCIPKQTNYTYSYI